MAIGIVRALVGTTTATDSRGNTRVLRVGDAVELNETIQSSAGSTVLIQFDNGGFATVGSNDKLVLDQSVLDPTGNTRTAEAAGQSVEDIQAMICLLYTSHPGNRRTRRFFRRACDGEHYRLQ